MIFAKAFVIGPGALLAVLVAFAIPIIAAGYYFRWFWKPPKK